MDVKFLGFYTTPSKPAGQVVNAAAVIGGGGWRNTELHLGTCKDGSDITNSGGYLECTRK